MANHLRDGTIYLVGHAHIDLGYRWRWNETVQRVARDTFEGVLRMMDEVPELIFVQSQLALYEAMAETYPALFARIKARVAEGRWIVADGWTEYDHTMPAGEAMIRQHLIGSDYARRALGVEVRLAWAPDAFSGHVHTLPTILKGCGISHLLFGRGMPEDTPFFWWVGPDGARVLAYTPAFSYSATISPELLRNLERWHEMTGSKEMLVLYGRGDHGGGPREEDIEALQEMRADPEMPRLIHIDPHRFMAEVLEKRDDLKEYQGELGGGFTGSCSSEGRNKQRNRMAENLLLTAERFATLATFLQRKPHYPRVDFENAWKLVLRHQFHDELPGTSRAAVYEDNMADYDAVDAMVGSILNSALAEISGRLNTEGPGVPVVVFNPLAWARTDAVSLELRLNQQPTGLVIRDSAGQEMPTQLLHAHPDGHYWRARVLFLARDVPAMGYKLFRAFLQPPDAGAVSDVRLSRDAMDYVLENAFYRMRVSGATGQITSLYDRLARREMLAAPANVLQAIREAPGEHSAWIIALTNEMHEMSTPDAVEIARQGPVQAAVRVSYRFRDSYFVQEIGLTADVPRVNLALHADWYERDCALKVAFPVAVANGVATFDQPYGSIVRPANGDEVPAQYWVDLSTPEQGVSLLNNCRYAFDINGQRMRMTLLRGIPDLDPQADVGHHALEYALYPHSGDWRQALTVRAGLELNLPLLARQEMHRAGMMQQWARPDPYQSMPDEFSFLHVQPANIVMTALKVEHEHWGEFAPFVVRCYETAGVETEAVLSFAAPLRFAEETDHLERPLPQQTLQQEGERVTLTFRPHEIKTLRLSLAIPGFAIYPGAHRDATVPGESGGFERG